VRRLNDEQVAKLVDRYLDGATMNALAELFEIHRTTVSLYLKPSDPWSPAFVR
jgi:hypothetical protein